MEEVWMSTGAIAYEESLDPSIYIDSSFADNTEG